MKSSAFLGFTLGVAAVLLAGCGGSQPAIGAGGAIPYDRAVAAPVERATRKRGAAERDLLYLASQSGSVYVYSYPQLELVTTLGNLNQAAFGECSDGAGDVFITTATSSGAGTIYEYAHGGTTPIQTLSDPGSAYGCAIDPKTGNLAVSNIYDRTNPSNSNGDVAVYTTAKGSPIMYYADNPELRDFFFCGYDTAGNLYATVLSDLNAADSVLIRLPIGSSSFQMINVSTILHGESSVQWNGGYLVASSSKTGAPLDLYRLKVNGNSAKVVGMTTLNDDKDIFNGQVLVRGRSAIALGAYKRNYQSAFFWPYPKGGPFRARITKVGNARQTIWGVAYSAARSL